MSHHFPPTHFHVADMGAFLTVLVSWSGALPAIATLLACIWYALQIYEFWRNRK